MKTVKREDVFGLLDDEDKQIFFKTFEDYPENIYILKFSKILTWDVDMLRTT